MADNFGTGVSRVLNPKKTQFTQVVWQQNKPPLDSELNLLQQISTNWDQSVTLKGVPSGWVGNGVNDHEAYMTNPAWSNWFRFGQQSTGELGSVQWAVVNGWVVPVSGTRTGTPPGSPNDVDTWNKITLGPPPSNSGDSRVDFAFLEVWQALIPPNPGTTNKPSSSGIWQYGNVESGYSFLPDQLIDPALGFETTQRVQIQYRIRVVQGLVGLSSFPDGFDPASVKGRGSATADTSFTFTNMRKELGDPGLWRAGDGTANSLGTVDGYTYAIPLSAVFRRNSVAWDGDPGQNLNGGFNRNPTAVDRTGVKTFTSVPTVTSAMTAGQLTLSLSTATNIALPTSPATPVYIQVGDEIMTYSAITGTTATINARGQLGTKAEAHAAGEQVLVLSGRPDGLFSDQIAKSDILDLRHVVNPNGFDYDTLLKGNLDKLLRGQLRANWKRSGGGPVGPLTLRQDKISATPAALGVSKLDQPNNYREIWSDASVLQPMLLIAKPPVSVAVAQDVAADWDLGVTATMDNLGGGSNVFSPSTSIVVPIAQFKNTVPGSDSDQVSFPQRAGSDTPLVVTLRLAGSDTDLLYGTDYTVNTPTGPTDDLVITLEATFNGSTPTDRMLFVKFHVQYGAGRGLSALPDYVHSVAYLNTSSGTLLRQKGTQNNNIPISTGYAPLWSKFRSGMYNGMTPVAAESYVDPGSKTVVLTPFRRIALPTEDVSGTTAFQAIKDNSIHGGAGLMPNPASKWGATTDPLELFSGVSDNAGNPNRGNTYVVMPRNLIPGWGAVHVPIIHTDTSDFAEGINFGFLAGKGAVPGDLATFVPFTNTGARTFATFSTIDQATAGTSNTTLTYNTLAITAGVRYAGMRFFTDTRGLGRTGLSLPPFYGISRLFSVYNAVDFGTGMSTSYDSTTRAFTGAGAENLLKQDFEGSSIFIEIDEDGDSYFVLNGDCIKDFDESNHYVIEASVFGFDRGAFSLGDDCRIVLTRERADATNAASDSNMGTDVELVIPAPAQGSDSVAINFSRVPYQGDLFHSQNSGQDTIQLMGPVSSANANAVGYTELDLDNLTRPNQKVVEVLASTGFLTTMGTGRVTGDFDSTSELDWRFPGYEDVSAYPPTSPVAARPEIREGSGGSTLSSTDELLPLGTEYMGAIERLPLGALFRSKDFRGNAIGSSPLGFVYMDPNPGQAAGVDPVFGEEIRQLPVFTSSLGSGGPGEIIVHVDGESDGGNFSNLTNFRTTRGGSAFLASGDRKGGGLGAHFSSQTAGPGFNTVLACVAYLVRLRPTSVGSTEVSAGGELALLISTTACRRSSTVDTPIFMICGTNGSGEGFSAADLFRISGRPLVTDGVRIGVTPSTIQLNPPVSYKPRLGG